MSVLEKIHCHDDLVNLSQQEQAQLCAEIRTFLVENVSKTGGHLASNLGMVELSVAIETVFETEKDRLVFDVGHQSYVHKMLTGRQAEFAGLRQFGGMAGFPKPSESVTDAFVAGHASSSVSIALGMARARTLLHEKYNIVTVLGDGAATGGMAYEGLNDVAVSGEPMVIILNDNEMSISHNVGGLSQHLSKLRSKAGYLSFKQDYRRAMSKNRLTRLLYRMSHRIKTRLKRLLIPSTIFENMGLSYVGPVDGNDLQSMIALLRIAKESDRPVLIHVHTQKGKGYQPAVENPAVYHGVGKFDPEKGVQPSSSCSFSQNFGQFMVDCAAKNPKLCAITAAMPDGTGLVEFMKAYPNRTFDVGIAEEHAISMAGGLAKQGMTPVVAIYSTFLQRGFDQIMQDIALQQLHVVLAVDRAGLVGEDGETHHGVFDVGFLSSVPGMTILCPCSLQEQTDMLSWAVNDCNGPVAVRYPRGGNRNYTASNWNDSGIYCHQKGTDVVLVTYGVMIDNVLEAAKVLESKGISSGVVRLLSVAPIPVDGLLDATEGCKNIVIVEDACAGSGIKEAISWEIHQKCPEIQVNGIDLGHRFATHGCVPKLYEHYGLDGASIADFVLEVCR